MAKQTINIGSTANDGTGSTLRVGGDLINDNFNEIYTTFGDGSTLSNAIPGKVQGANFTGSILVGHSTTGAINSATGNTGVGIQALDALTSGDSNVALGYNAGGAVTTGKKNILIGANAGDNITSGTGNVIIGNADAASSTGHQTLKISGTNYNGSSTVTWIEGDISGNLVTPGTITANGILLGAGLAHKLGGTNFTNSLLVGHSTTGTLSSASDNTGVGVLALDALSSGIQNTAVGTGSLGGNANGSYNAAFGRAALASNTNGSQNVAFGWNALSGASSNYNTAIGHATASNASMGGAYNTFLGHRAGDSHTSGAGNVMLGAATEVASASGNRQLTIGGYDGTNTTTWITGDSAGLLTITGGEVIPGKKGGTNFTNSLLIGHSTTGTLDTADDNIGIGIGAMDAITTGDSNTVIGKDAGTGVTTGNKNVIVGAGAASVNGTNLRESTYIGFEAGKISTSYQNVGVGKGSLALNQNSGNYNTAIGTNSGGSIVNADYNVTLGRSAGFNITNGSGNVIIGSVNADSSTGDRQLKIAGNDGTTTTTWISGASNGQVTMTLAANQITSTQLTGATNLQILASDGTVLKTLFGAGS